MSKVRSGFGPRIIGDIKGLEKAQISAAQLTYAKPKLPFLIASQVPVNDKGEYDAENPTGMAGVNLEYHFKIDPAKMTSEHVRRIEAAQSRYRAAAKTLSSFNLPGVATKKMTKDDLPDADIMQAIMEELDDANNSRLVDVTMKDEDGDTMWDYSDANGNAINLTKSLLESDPRLKNAMIGALDDFLNGSNLSSVEVSKTTPTKASTDSTAATPKASSTDSDTLSSNPKKEKTTTERDSSQSGLSQ